jgi:hypothetical protein
MAGICARNWSFWVLHCRNALLPDALAPGSSGR